MLEQYRKELDNIDNQIIDLLNQRFEICIKIGEYKKEKRQNIFDPQRELVMFERLAKQEKYENMVNSIFPYITKFSRQLQEQIDF